MERQNGEQKNGEAKTKQCGWASPNQFQQFRSKFSKCGPSFAIVVQVQQLRRSKLSRKREFWCKNVGQTTWNPTLVFPGVRTQPVQCVCMRRPITASLRAHYTCITKSITINQVTKTEKGMAWDELRLIVVGSFRVGILGIPTRKWSISEFGGIVGGYNSRRISRSKLDVLFVSPSQVVVVDSSSTRLLLVLPGC
eukprot:1285864-Rhodomonas_salina.1